jgi:cohesin loading factor subunit SCC2
MFVASKLQPNISQTQVQSAVQKSFLDTSISVREATVDLVGKYVLERPEFLQQYFKMISERLYVSL